MNVRAPAGIGDVYLIKDGVPAEDCLALARTFIETPQREPGRPKVYLRPHRPARDRC